MSTLRQIRPVNTRGVDPAAISDLVPEFAWVDPGTLYVEEIYQRGIVESSLTMIRKIVGRWNWAHIKPPVCVRDGKGRMVVIDGQHTAIAAVSHGGIEKVPVMIVHADSLEARAKAFISQNKDRIALTPMHIFYASLAAGDEVAVAVDDACRKAGVTILRAGRGTGGIYKVGETFAIGVISRIVERVGVKQGSRMLKVLIDAKRAPMPAHEIAAVAILMFDPKYKGSVDLFDLATVIRSRSVLAWKAAAAAVTAKGLTPRAALAAVWHKALRNA